MNSFLITINIICVILLIHNAIILISLSRFVMDFKKLIESDYEIQKSNNRTTEITDEQDPTQFNYR